MLSALALASCIDRRETDLPSAYRDLEVPQARLASPAARARGRAIFLARCALCHGERADGQGVRQQALSSQPANLTLPAWRRRMTPRRVYFLVREGKPGTSMPGWKSLSPEETWDVVGFVLAASEKGNA